MKSASPAFRLLIPAGIISIFLVAAAAVAYSQAQVTNDPPFYGPYNAVFLDHRAIFEGMNAHLWAPNSGRLLWMTQPAWPSNTW
jgi:hypothetical protein